MRTLTADFRSSALKLAVGSLSFLGFAAPAYAYLDPGTGSMILQGLIAGVAGAAVVVRLYWDRLKTFFTSKKSDTAEDTRANASENSAEQ